jgi:uncharacterized membrane protein
VPIINARKRQESVMSFLKKLSSSVVLFLTSCWALGAMKEMDQAANAPVETVSMVYVVLFIVAFIGMIVGFLGYMWWADKNKKKEQ